MYCEHCNQYTLFEWKGIALCNEHGAMYFPNELRDGCLIDPRLDDIYLAVRTLGLDVIVHLDCMVITYPNLATFEYNDKIWVFGKVTSTWWIGDDDVLYEVSVLGGEDGEHPHTFHHLLCLGTWQDQMDDAIRDEEWERLVLLAYEAACHYNSSGAYFQLDAPCSLCQTETRSVCINCREPYCGCGHGELCPYCSSWCDACENYVSTVAPCEICGTSLCEDCQRRCDECGEYFCYNCLKGGFCESCKEKMEESVEEVET